MFDFFEKLRKKTRRERQIFALVSSLCVTLLIFGVWAALKLPKTFESVAERQEESKNTISPIANVKTGFKGAMDSISKEFSDLKEKLSPTFEEEFIAPDIKEKDFKKPPENAKMDN